MLTVVSVALCMLTMSGCGLISMLVGMEASKYYTTINGVSIKFKLNETKTEYWIESSDIAGKTPKNQDDLVDLVIPAEHNGLPVTGISMFAFQDSDVIRSVTIPESMVDLRGAFSDCDSIERVEIPKSVLYLHGSTFYGCVSLKAVDIDPDNPNYCSVDGNIYSKDGSQLVFYAPGKAEKEFRVPSGVAIISRLAFTNCNHLERILIPRTVEQITWESIQYCDRLQGISVDESNETYCSIDGNLYSKDRKTLLRQYVMVGDTELVIPEGVTTIASRACCGSLTSVIIPGSVRHMESAFSGCDKLTSAYFQVPEGWTATHRGKFVTKTPLDPQALSDPATAAVYLRDTYRRDEWVREG